MDAPAVQRRPSAATRFALWYIGTYRALVAPRLRARCHFEPTCSAYALAAYQRYSFVRATAKTLWRLLRCNPLRRGAGVYDPP